MTSKIILFVFLFGSFVYGQDKAKNTLKFEEGTTSPKATLTDVSWLSGYWKGNALGGTVEEIWSNPLGGSMMFSFKLVADGKVKFYEIGGITEKENTLFMQLKHFHSDFKGWEEKDETVDFKLVKLEENRVFFDQLSFEKISDTEMNVYVIVGNEDGTEQEVKFNYKKQ
ncbi:DUF6265 family protein [Aquimarina gracilis]|uniref:DUF6265 family protein n=1 Tax=Aquimarina gracilis TaxID=874422 RepID=A0ABU5ZZU3_9FLAO|nr:DUF6265 family protein [Aquimarina gracilis]MEB3347340.1 DUF6265 family protein [Aquimarina gracilis]